MNHRRRFLHRRDVVAFILLVVAAVVLTVTAAHAAHAAPPPLLPDPTPVSTVQWPGHDGKAVAATRAGNVIVTGTMGTAEVIDGGTATRRTWNTGPAEAVVWDAGTLYVGTADGSVQRWDSPAAKVWERHVGTTVHDIALLAGSGYLLVGSYGPDPLTVVRASDGTVVDRVDLDGQVYGLSVNDARTRAVVIGKHLVAEGDDTRPHILVYDLDGIDVTVTGWTHYRANLHCLRTRDGVTTERVDTAHLRDVAWSPDDGPHAGRFAVVATGGAQRRGTGYCDSLTLLEGAVDGPAATVWSSRTCIDTLTAVAWAPGGRTIAAAGHHKCLEWRPGGRRGFGPDPDSPVYWTDRTGPLGPKVLTNAMGLSFVRAGSGYLLAGWWPKCRAYGADGLLWTDDRALHVAHDCPTFGTNEHRWVPDDLLRPLVPAEAYARMETP